LFDVLGALGDACLPALFTMLLAVALVPTIAILTTVTLWMIPGVACAVQLRLSHAPTTTATTSNTIATT